MAEDIRYSINVNSNFHIENFLGSNNRTNHSYFWLEEHDHGGREFRFASVLLSQYRTAGEIVAAAEQITSLFQGIYTLLDRNRNGVHYFTLGDIFDHDQKISIRNPRNIEIYRIDLDLASAPASIENMPVNPVYLLFEKICTEPFLANLFFLLSKKIDYRLLYMLYDDIRYLLKNDGDYEFLKPYKTALNDFSHTANNYEVLGYYARHGRTSNDPPAEPMSLEDSKMLIFEILAKLLNEKFGITLPDYWGMNYLPA
jgi:hypothetical protein